MMNHAPAILSLDKYIGRQHRRRNILAIERARQIFVKRDPGKTAAQLDGNIGEHETNDGSILEYAPPALHDRIPAAQNTPTRMAALNDRFPGPDFLHLFDVEALKGAVETFVDPGYFLLVAVHKTTRALVWA
jgi:hypothetical protein